MDNVNEKFSIEDEDLEKVAGGAGATKFTLNDFHHKLEKAYDAISGPNASYITEPLKAGDYAVCHDNYVEGKAQLILARDRADERGLKKSALYLHFTLQYLADCGKIDY